MVVCKTQGICRVASECLCACVCACVCVRMFARITYGFLAESRIHKRQYPSHGAWHGVTQSQAAQQRAVAAGGFHLLQVDGPQRLIIQITISVCEKETMNDVSEKGKWGRSNFGESSHGQKREQENVVKPNKHRRRKKTTCESRNERKRNVFKQPQAYEEEKQLTRADGTEP